MPDDDLVPPKPPGFRYAESYCEENIYHLAQEIPDSLVVFISNENKKVPFWHNRKRQHANEVIVWDYHVILVKGNMVWDFDTSDCLPGDFEFYSKHVLRTQQMQSLEPSFQRLYRVIRAKDYIEGFASDRSHMLRADGRYLSPIPPWPAIVSAQGQLMNLPELYDMTRTDETPTLVTSGNMFGIKGVVMDEPSFLLFMAGRKV